MKFTSTLLFVIGTLFVCASNAENWVLPHCNDSWSTTVYEVASEENPSSPRSDLMLTLKNVTIENKMVNRFHNMVTFARKNLFFVAPTAANPKVSLAIRAENGNVITIGTIEESITEDVELFSSVQMKNLKIPATCHRLQLFDDVRFSDEYTGKKWSAGGIALIIPVAGTTDQISLRISAQDELRGVSGSVLSKPTDGDYKLLGIFK